MEIFIASQDPKDKNAWPVYLFLKEEETPLSEISHLGLCGLFTIIHGGVVLLLHLCGMNGLLC